MNDQPDTDRLAPKAEPLVEVQRSASHVVMQAAETIAAGAGATLGALATKDLYGQAKDKLGSLGDGSKSNDSKD